MSGAAEKTKGAREAARDALAEVLRQIGDLEASVSNVDGDAAALHVKLNDYIASLKSLHSTAAPLVRSPGQPYEVPLELLQYLDDGGNPDIFMKDVMRSVVAANQASKGKVLAFREFQDRLIELLEEAYPEDIAEYKSMNAGNST